MAEDPDSLPEESSYYYKVTDLICTLVQDPGICALVTDITTLAPYCSFSGEAKVLFIRLYLRKRQWLRPASFSYKEVPDVPVAVEEMVKHRFLVRLKENSEEETVDSLLENMSQLEMKAMCKQLNLKTTGGKAGMSKAVVSMCRNQRSLFGGVAGTKKRVKEKCLDTLKHMIKINEGVASILDKVLIASLPQYLFRYEEDDKTTFTGKGNLSRILLSHFGLAQQFPAYSIQFSDPLFKSSHHLETFINACKLEASCWAALDTSNWLEIKSIYTNNIARFEEMSDVWDDVIPEDRHLLQFTEDWVLVRTMRKCLAALQRLKEYSAAVHLIHLLLKYKPMQHRRGEWWETLALIQDYHLKDPNAAKVAAMDGLKDPCTTHGYRIELEKRLAKLDAKFKPSFVFEPKTVTIDVVAIEGAGNAAKSRSFYVGYDRDGSTLLCDVEDVVLNYYINNNGFKEGCHAEGAIVATLFAIVCWEVIFSETNNVFYNPYQYHPLDFWSTNFFDRRKSQFQELFDYLNNITADLLNDLIQESWKLHYQTGCTGLNWDLFEDVQQCQRCVACITPIKLVKIFEEFLTDPRLKRSGFPDLAMWNHETGEFIAVEVKGPLDKLSKNQKVWLACLSEIGVKAEVCHVKAVSSKRL